MLHEVMHVAAEHCNWDLYGEKSGLNQYVLGIAMDHWINLTITGMGYQLPDWVHKDRKYTGWATMTIYHDLMKDPPPQPPDWQPDVLPGPGDMSADEYAETIQTNIMKAAMQAEMANDPGSIPGNIRIMIEDMISPQLPWNLILYKFMDEYAKEDYSWSRPNRRYVPDFYFPHMQSEKLAGVVSGIDVSGSMMDEIEEVMAENRYIKTLVNPTWFHLMTWDTKVHHDKVYEEFEDLPTQEIPGGGAGGTVIHPLIKLIVDKKPRFALIFTDGYFGKPDMSQVKSDIYWIISKEGDKNFKAPDDVGEVIHMN
jgi:predicted metal-dependent peptidase